VYGFALGLPVGDEPVAAVEHAGRLLEEAGHQVSTLSQDVFDPIGLIPFLNVINAGLSEMDGIDWDLVEPTTGPLMRRPRRSTA